MWVVVVAIMATVCWAGERHLRSHLIWSFFGVCVPQQHVGCVRGPVVQLEGAT